MSIEKITIDGKDYVPVKGFEMPVCYGCSFSETPSTACSLCKVLGENYIFREAHTPLPTTGDYTTIRSYVDACMALHRAPLILSDVQDIPDSTIDMLQLETIAEAIRGNDGPLLFDSRVTTSAYAPCFGRYMAEEMADQSDVLQKSALWVHTGTGVKEIFAMSHIAKIETNGYKCINPRIMQHSYEKALYLGGRHFVQYWATYFGLTFDDDDFYIKQPIG